MHVTLVESVGKKARFCEHVVQVLGLRDVDVQCRRVEELGQSPQHRESFDWSVGRAVADLGVLSEYALPLVRVGGAIVAQKGESGPAEAQSANAAIALLGGRLEQVIRVNLPGVVDDRFLVVISKVASTPSAYPRKAGVPSRQPL
jgi:16S rRNA (guanine527-N7)-methyltransferase